MSMLGILKIVLLTDILLSKGLSDNIKKYEAFSAIPQEKVFLHLDNNAYCLGDTIWYKAYVEDAKDRKSPLQSQILYVDMLTQGGVFVMRNKHAIKQDGTCEGFIPLDSMVMDAGTVEIRAYSAWMTRFHDPKDSLAWETLMKRVSSQKPMGTYLPAFRQNIIPGSYSKVVSIYCKNGILDSVSYNSSKSISTDSIQIQFYPEGGHYVKGKNVRIALEIRDSNGKSIAPRCNLSKNGKKIKSLQIGPNGRAIVSVSPAKMNSSDSLTIECDWLGKHFSVPFPKPESSGVVLMTKAFDNEVKLRLQCVNLPDDSLYVLLASHGKIHQLKQVKTTVCQNIKFNLADIEPGIGQIVVTTTNGQTLASRLFFHCVDNNHVNYTNIRKIKQEKLNSFQKIKCLLKPLASNPDNFANSTFSVSVRDNAWGDDIYTSDNILTNMLLSSEIKDHVDNPAYYFESNDPEHMRELDLLMLVQGWSRYDWENSIEHSWFDDWRPSWFKPEIENTLCIAGVFKCKTLNINASDKYYMHLLLKNDSLTFIDTIFCVKQGEEFVIPTGPIIGKCDILYQIYEKETVYNGNGEFKDSLIMYDNQRDRYSIYHSRPLYWPRPRQLSYKERQIQGQMGNINYPTRIEYPFLVGYNMKDFCSYPVNTTPFITDDDFFELFAGQAMLPPIRRPKLIISDGNSTHIWSMWNNSNRYDARNYQYILFYADMPNRSRYLQPLCPQNDFSIKIVLVTADTCRNVKNELMPIMDSLKQIESTEFVSVFHGYQPKGSFYSPDYSNNLLPEKDNRHTLYWNPNVKSDSLGQILIDCFNNKTASRVFIEINGRGRDGTYVTSRFIVGK